MNFKNCCQSLKPHPIHTSFAEKLRSGVAGGLGIFPLASALHFLPQP